MKKWKQIRIDHHCKTLPCFSNLAEITRILLTQLRVVNVTVTFDLMTELVLTHIGQTYSLYLSVRGVVGVGCGLRGWRWGSRGGDVGVSRGGGASWDWSFVF